MITATPTASSFSVCDNSDVNQTSDSYIAYIFAGGGPGGNIGGTVFGPDEDQYLCSTGWYY